MAAFVLAPLRSFLTLQLPLACTPSTPFPSRTERLRCVPECLLEIGCGLVRISKNKSDQIKSNLIITAALFMMPKYEEYGGWPLSGEIDIVEVRGNRDFVANGGAGPHIGVEQVQN
jgi:hypothetical protein